MQVDHSHLQYAAIQVAQWAAFSPPGCLKRFMRFEITALVEQFHAMNGFRMEGTLAISYSRLNQIGHFMENYIIPGNHVVSIRKS
jgi:hypothetical protein